MKKHIFSFILIMLCLFSVSAYAESEFFNYHFNSQKEEASWPGCFFDRSLSFGEGYCAFVTNPFGEVKNETVTHVIDYTDKIHLEAGKTYTLSGYVMNPLNNHNQTIRTNAKLENGANTIIVSVAGADSEWSEFSTTFYAGKTGEFNLSLHFLQGNIDFGFFIDEISLFQTAHTLSSIKIEGPSEILIPVNLTSTNAYQPVLIASDGTEISILSSESVVSTCSRAKGVSYNSSDFTLSISPDAVTNTKLTLDFSLNNFPSLSLYSHEVFLTDNLISDSSLSEKELLWESTSKISRHTENENSYISFSTNDYGDFGFFSTLTYDTPQMLIEGELYVLRARVKSDTAPSAAVFAKNTAQNINNTVYFNVNNISSDEWTEVFAAFVPEKSGIYTIALNLCSAYDCTIFADDIRLCAESSKPEYMTLHAPGNIVIPDIKTDYPFSVLLRDQLGNIIETNEITVSMTADNKSISFDSNTGKITVYPDTIQGIYTINAFYTPDPSISASLPVTVGFDYIGDGEFENKSVGEWWVATSPFECNLYIRNDGYSKRALASCDGEYMMLLNNSYVNLIEGTPYVFNGNFSSAVDCTVTVFIEALDATLHPLVQLTVPGGTTLQEKLIPELFLAETNVVGRPFLYIQSNDGKPFSIYADNLSLKKTSVVADNLHIIGNTNVNGSAEAMFSFYNNVSQNNDTSSSIVTWYVSDNPHTNFTMLDTYGKHIYFDTTFLNKYVYFEVIPVCPITGFAGETVRSATFMITYEKTDSSLSQTSFKPITLSKPDNIDFFEDITGHWCHDYINILSYNGVVNGKSKKYFAPDDYVTRAEVAKLICSAFSIKPVSQFSQFKDIKPSDWFYNHVCALNLSGIVKGTSSDTFSPNLTVTREDAVVMIMRVYEHIKGRKAYPETVFSDKVKISSYAQNYVSTAASLGFVSGNTDGEFKPKRNITRAEAVAILYRVLWAMQ